MRGWLALLAVAAAGCATLNTSGMSEHCRRLYNACLNNCPNASTPGPEVISPDWRVDVAGCTNDCNERARTCR